MSRDVQLTMNVLEYLTHHRGTAYTAQEISHVVYCSLSQAQSALETLADAGLVTRLPLDTGVVTYLIPA